MSIWAALISFARDDEAWPFLPIILAIVVSGLRKDLLTKVEKANPKSKTTARFFGPDGPLNDAHGGFLRFKSFQVGRPQNLKQPYWHNHIIKFKPRLPIHLEIY